MTKESTYTPISQRENIEDEDIAKIADYLERHSKKMKLTAYKKNFVGVNFDNKRLYIDKYRCFEIYRTRGSCIPFLRGDFRILSENIVGIYASIKNIS